MYQFFDLVEETTTVLSKIKKNTRFEYSFYLNMNAENYLAAAS